jgi:hypothetical protein
MPEFAGDFNRDFSDVLEREGVFFGDGGGERE